MLRQDIVWRKVDGGLGGPAGGGSLYTERRHDRPAYVTIGTVHAADGDRFDGRFSSLSGYSSGSYSGAGFGSPGYSGQGRYETAGRRRYGGILGDWYRGADSGWYAGSGSGPAGLRGRYAVDEYLTGGSSGCAAGCGCGRRPWYRCAGGRRRRRRRQVLGGRGNSVSCWITQGLGWSTLTLAQPGPQDEGLYMCVGRTVSSRAVSMEVQLSRYVAGGGRYRSALMKAQPDTAVAERTETDASGAQDGGQSGSGASEASHV